MLLTDDMKHVVLTQKLGFVATVTADGRPRVSPKGTTTVYDDGHLMFIDVASPGTVANLAANPHVEINVVDPIVRTGYRFTGVGTVHTSGPQFENALAVARSHGSNTKRDRIRSIVIVEVTDARSLRSPAYDDGATEDDIAAQWLARTADLHGHRAPPRL